MPVLEQRVGTLEETLARYMARTDELLERMDRNIERLDRNVERLDRSYEEMRRESREHTLHWAQIAERVGRFAEDIVAPNIPRMAREIFGITETQFAAQRIEKRHATDASRFREFDQVLAGQGKVILVETKATARLKSIEDFAEVIKEFVEYFPEYRNFTLLPIYASMALSSDFVRRLSRLRIYAMALGDRTMELLNLAEVSAKRG
jgi:DNA-binding protein H-NS